MADKATSIKARAAKRRTLIKCCGKTSCSNSNKRPLPKNKNATSKITDNFKGIKRTTVVSADVQNLSSFQAGIISATIPDETSLAENPMAEVTNKMDPKSSETTDAIVPDQTTLAIKAPTQGPLADEISSPIPNPALTSSISLDQKPASSDATPSSASEANTLGLLRFLQLTNIPYRLAIIF
jgi:hypothetical protein